MTSNHPQRRRQSRARVFGAFIAAQRRPLTGAGAKGTPATDARPCIFNTFTRSNRHVYAPEPRTRRFASNCLIPLTFTHSNL